MEFVVIMIFLNDVSVYSDKEVVKMLNYVVHHEINAVSIISLFNY